MSDLIINPSCGSRVVPFGQTDGQTDMTKISVAFRNILKEHKKQIYSKTHNLSNFNPTSKTITF